MRQAPFIEETNATFSSFLTLLKTLYVNVDPKSSTGIQPKRGRTNSCHPIFSFIPAKDIRANMTNASPSSIPGIHPKKRPHKRLVITLWVELRGNNGSDMLLGILNNERSSF